MAKKDRQSAEARRAAKTVTRRQNRRLLGYAGREWKILAGSFSLVIATVATELVAPLIVGTILDDQLVEGIGVRIMRSFVLLLVFYAGIMGLNVLTDFLSRFTSRKAAIRISQHIRDDVFDHLQRMPLAYYDKLPAGQIVSRLTSDIKTLQVLYEFVLNELTLAAISVSITYGMLFYLEPAAAAWLLIPIALLIVIIQDYRGKSATFSTSYRKHNSILSSTINEDLANMTITQAYNEEEQVMRKFKKNNNDLFNDYMDLTILDSYSSGNAISTLRYLSIAFILFVYGYTWLQGDAALSPGMLFIFIDYTSRIFNRMHHVGQRMGQLERARAAANHVFELLDIEPELDPAYDAILARSDEKGQVSAASQQEAERISTADPERRPDLARDPLVSFRDISFAYIGDHDVLKGVSFEVRRGATVAFVGHTGSGKSTIMNLMLRFYDPQRGEISLGGEELMKINRLNVREPIAMVLQDPFLFTGTVYDNIAMGSGISREQALEALIEVGGSFFLERHTQGLDTPVAQNGQDFSTGERQLLSFARALAQDPAILILDEATAHVDTETEILIQKGIAAMSRGRTTLIIAHRLSTIRHADEILVMDAGEIKERGTHEQLLARGGLYSDMHSKQSEIVS